MNDFEMLFIAYMVYRDKARLIIPMSPCATGISCRVEADKAGDKPLPYMGVCFCAFCLRVSV